MRKLLLPLLLFVWLIPNLNAQTNEVSYKEEWKIMGYENKDLGTFLITKYEDWTCEIVFTVKGKTYKSYECSENFAKLSNGIDSISINYTMPELVQLDVDIIGNEIKFDYTSNYQEEINEDKIPPYQSGNMGNPNYNETSFTIKVNTNKNECKGNFGTICLKINSGNISYNPICSTSADNCLIKSAIKILGITKVQDGIDKIYVKFIE